MDNDYAKLTPRVTDALKTGKAKLNGGAPPPMVEDIAKPEPVSVEPAQPPVAPVAAPKPLKVAIIGTAPSSRDFAPFNDPEWTIWACSPGNMNILPRVDAWFEVHSNLMWPEHQSYGAPYLEWLKQQKFPIYMQDQRFVPNATPLPINDLVKEFGKYFFTSSFAYMMAMAIMHGATDIALFGVDMASRGEYIMQRAGGQFFIQEAAKRGIRVHLPHESDLAQHPGLYGYVDSTPFGRKMYVREQELKGRIAQMEQEMAKLQQGVTYLKGALEDIDYLRTIWGGMQT